MWPTGGASSEVCLCPPIIALGRPLISLQRALLEGASGVFEQGGKKAPEIDEEHVKELHAKIGELGKLLRPQ